MPVVDYEKAHEVLKTLFADAEAIFLKGTVPDVGETIRKAYDIVFASRTQAYREALLGCTLARLLDPTINVRLPYVDQGPDAFSGRSLDERVVNPFLQDRRIPSSRGPYLSCFRRSVRFDKNTRRGLRDKQGYDAFLEALSYLEEADSAEVREFLLYQLYKFVELREEANIPLSRLQRISLEQYDRLITILLETPSGGLFPVLLSVAMFRTIKAHFGLDWDVSWQGINVADAASGAGGDITVVSGDAVILAVEVTERPVGRERVVATFNTKIGPASIEDYLFLLGRAEATPEAKRQAQQYFAQGHEVNFIGVKDWVLMLLATMGIRGRKTFNAELMALLDGAGIPKALRVSWNDSVNSLMGT
ncbi:MAG TPA: restriction endonuclease, SacI family [Chloroflexi bacterium]|jgi:hypothetical protein|nr:restriction endonuclease, SacI family [Chloroflexota bacterium]